MKRSELKAIIKECLVEILAEGMGGGLKGQITEAQARQPQQRPAPHMRRPQQAAAPNPMKEHIKALTTGNDVLADMLAHTAMTTLPTQMQAPDPERSLAGVQAMMGAGGHGFYPNMPQEPEPPMDFYPMINETSAPAPVRGGGGIGGNPMWDQLAFGSPSAGAAAHLAGPPPMLRKLTAAELERKVG